MTFEHLVDSGIVDDDRMTRIEVMIGTTMDGRRYSAVAVPGAFGCTGALLGCNSIVALRNPSTGEPSG